MYKQVEKHGKSCLIAYHIYLCIKQGFNHWNDASPPPLILYTSQLSGLVSNNRYNLFYVSVRYTCVSTKDVNLIHNYQW